MNKAILYTFLILSLVISSCTSDRKSDVGKDIRQTKIYKDSKPWTRWWWFASMIDRASVQDNLQWLKDNGFGGVEIAWVYPLNRMRGDTTNYTPRQEWQSAEWSEIVAYAKQYADSLGLGCDFTFGTLWPFGDTKVPFGEATMNMKDADWRQAITRSWEYPKSGYVVDHLSAKAFQNYAQRMGNALMPALRGNVSGLFCDSWEVETRYLSTPGFEDKFLERYGYKISDYKDSLYSNSEPYRSVRYDYMKLISEYTIDNFYKHFTRISHELGAYSRAQCSGAPCDIISAYSVIDIPESEALLFEPSFSNIVASAASLSGKNIVSSETFTCLYGWPDNHHSEEQTADLKLLVDALFANGVNHIIWHGKPYNIKDHDTTKFYASVHVGKSGSLAEELPVFNKYIETVTSFMKKGRNYSEVAVYLPVEDSWIAGELPLDKQFIWAWGEYEMRYAYLPEELKGYRPLWINGEFLEKAEFEKQRLIVGDLSFKALYIDVAYLDIKALAAIADLAAKGLPVCMKEIPSEPGLKKTGKQYADIINRLEKMPNVKKSWAEVGLSKPLIMGVNNFDYWCREADDSLFIFFSHPGSKNLKFPLEYGQSLNEKKETYSVVINYKGEPRRITLDFLPYQSILVKIYDQGFFRYDTEFFPKNPTFIPRVKKGKDKWEVQ